MEKFNKIIESAKKNDYEITYEQIEKLNLNENEYEELLNLLKFNSIKIIDEEAKSEYNSKSASDDYMKAYFKDITKYPLLTLEEEKDLFQRLKQEKNIDEKKKIREKLINSNLRFVLSIAIRSKYKYNTKLLSILDLVQEGSFGLMKAIDKFDLSKGVKLSTYARWWIMQTITRSIMDQEKIIKIPVSQEEKIKKCSMAEARFENEFGEKPTIEDLVSKTGLKRTTIEEIKTNKQIMLSLETPIGEKNSTLKDFIPDKSNCVEEYIIKKIYINEIYNKIKIHFEKKGKQRELLVLKLRNGVGTDHEWTLKEISDSGLLGDVTSERVRQIELFALKIARNFINKYLDEKINITSEDVSEEDNLQTLDALLYKILNPFEYKIIKLIKGTKDLPKMTPEQISIKFKISVEKVLETIKKANHKIDSYEEVKRCLESNSKTKAFK